MNQDFKKYKLLVTDLDGTAISINNYDKPTDATVKAFSALQKVMQVSIATGRTAKTVPTIARELGVFAPCVISGGSQIIDPKTEKILWQKLLQKSQILEILKYCKGHTFKLSCASLPNAPIDEIFKKDLLHDIARMAVNNLSAVQLSQILENLKSVSEIAVCRVTSMVPEMYDIQITHEHGTKGHGLEQLLKILNINKQEVIAVGDGDNDIALFRGAGYRVGMRGGDSELLGLADYVTDSVEQDGLANFINGNLL